MEPKHSVHLRWFASWAGLQPAAIAFEEVWNSRVHGFNGQYNAADAEEKAAMDERQAVATGAAGGGKYEEGKAELNQWSAVNPALPIIRDRFGKKAARATAKGPLEEKERTLAELPADMGKSVRDEVGQIRSLYDAEGTELQSLEGLPNRLNSLTPELARLDEESKARLVRQEQKKIILRSAAEYQIPEKWTGPLALEGKGFSTSITEKLSGEYPPQKSLDQANDLYEWLYAIYPKAKIEAENTQLSGRLIEMAADLTTKIETLRPEIQPKYASVVKQSRGAATRSTLDQSQLLQAESALLGVEGDLLTEMEHDPEVRKIIQAVSGTAVPEGATAKLLADFNKVKEEQLAKLPKADLFEAQAAQKVFDAEVKRITEAIAKAKGEFAVELNKLAQPGVNPALSKEAIETIQKEYSLDELAAARDSVGLANLAKLDAAFQPSGKDAGPGMGAKQLKAFMTAGVGGPENLRDLFKGFRNDAAELGAFAKGLAPTGDYSAMQNLLGLNPDGSPSKEKTGKLAPKTLGALLEGASGGKAAGLLSILSGATGNDGPAKDKREGLRSVLEDGGLADSPKVLGGLLPRSLPGETEQAKGDRQGKFLQDLSATFPGKKGAVKFKALLDSGFVPDQRKDEAERVSPDCLGKLLHDGFGGNLTHLVTLGDAAQEKGQNVITGLIVDAGLGNKTDILLPLVKGSLAGDSKELIRLGKTFENRRDCANLKGLIDAGGLDGAEIPGVPAPVQTAKPELLNDLLANGFDGDFEKLKQLGTAFGSDRQRAQLKGVIDVFRQPPHGPPPGGPGAQINTLLSPSFLNGDVGKLQSKFAAGMANIEEPTRKVATSAALRFLRADLDDGNNDHVATSVQARNATRALAGGNGITQARIDHFLTRHVPETFLFAEKKLENTQWPPETTQDDLKAYVETALKGFTGPMQAGSSNTQKFLLVTLGNGKKVGVQLAWKQQFPSVDRRLTQFFPLTLDQAAARWPAQNLTTANYLPGVMKFTSANMSNIRNAVGASA